MQNGAAGRRPRLILILCEINRTLGRRLDVRDISPKEHKLTRNGSRRTRVLDCAPDRRLMASSPTRSSLIDQAASRW
jgi:hypothetical protein